MYYSYQQRFEVTMRAMLQEVVVVTVAALQSTPELSGVNNNSFVVS